MGKPAWVQVPQVSKFFFLFMAIFLKQFFIKKDILDVNHLKSRNIYGYLRWKYFNEDNNKNNLIDNKLKVVVLFLKIIILIIFIENELKQTQD